MRYHSIICDNARWDGFELRPDDIIISTPPKCGTTWTQMLIALLVFDGSDFPAPLAQISPWMDMCNRTIEDVHESLDAQEHRRFIKTHTPLDGLPERDDISYVVVGRDPRDVAISFDAHRENMDGEHFRELRAATVGMADLAWLPPRPEIPDDPEGRFRFFVNDAGDVGRPTLTRVLHHLDTAWQRRQEPNLLLCHYGDFKADLPGELRRLAGFLGYEVDDARAGELAAEASFDRMRGRATEVAPGVTEGNWKDNEAFFRTGALGEWRGQLTDDQLALYDARVAELVTPDLATWVHGGRLGSGIDPVAV